jgi:hypothetical protein
VQADNPVAYCKARVFLVQKAVRLEGYSSPMPIQTQSVAATIAFLKDLAHEGDDPRVNEMAASHTRKGLIVTSPKPSARHATRAMRLARPINRHSDAIRSRA